MNYDVASAIIRIEEMERIFDVLCSFAKADPKVIFSHPHLSKMLETLTAYYDGGISNVSAYFSRRNSGYICGIKIFI